MFFLGNEIVPNSYEESVLSWPYKEALKVNPIKRITIKLWLRVLKKVLFVLTKRFLQFIQSYFDNLLYGAIWGALKYVINYFLGLSSWVTKDF